MALLLLCPVLFCVIEALILDGPRNVVKELHVTNGGPWGTLGSAQFCPEGAFAAGYSMQIEPAQGYGGDDTSLNSIALYCEYPETGEPGGKITSGTGFWGSWGQRAMCTSNSSDDSIMKSYLNSFILQVEGVQHDGDDTAANFVKFKYKDLVDELPSHELSVHPGSGLFGTFGTWSNTCDFGTAICGLNTRLEGDQHGGDDTSLNDVVFYCCTD